MPSLTPILNFDLKVCFFIHFTCITFILMGDWPPTAHVFYNFILILFLIWSIYNRNNAEPLELAISVNSISIILDMMVLIMCFPSRDAAVREQFSAAMCILHLIYRLFSIIFLIKNLEERSDFPCLPQFKRILKKMKLFFL